MTTESKTFFQKYWQAILIAVSINIVIGVATNIGAYKVVLYKIENNIIKDELQEMSINRNKQNLIYIAAKENLDLPYR